MVNRKEIQIMGSTWTIVEGTKEDFPPLSEVDGYTDVSAKLIVVDNLVAAANDKFCQSNLTEHKNRVLRHEIIHAFLEECGLNDNSNAVAAWATNEEMVEWFATQLPKIIAVCAELDILVSKQITNITFEPFEEV